MKLVFIHGWGFDPHVWDQVAALLPRFPQQRIDLGFFGKPTAEVVSGDRNILVGHSFGFVHGINQRQDWRGWIAINSFPRFVQTPARQGCVSAAALRDMRIRLDADPVKTLHGFYTLIGAPPPEGAPDTARLHERLYELRDSDVGSPAAGMPGLVLASRNDPLVPSAASEELAAGKTIKWHESGGHILPHSDAEFCARAIAAFCGAL